jgi:hypothetical protein
LNPALAEIRAEALAEEGAQPGVTPGDGAQPGVTSPTAAPAPTQAEQDELEARSWAEIPATFGAVVSMPMPELAEVYSDEHCLEWGRAVVPIARRYGWRAGGGMQWLRLLGVTFALARPTVAAVMKRRRAALEASPKKDDAAADAGVRGEARSLVNA